MSAKDMMMRYATPLTTWLFLISLVSGVALFLHVGTSYFREMHELLSMLLILPFGLHVWKNWRQLLAYFRKSAMWISTLACLAAAGLFAYGGAVGTGGSGDPRMAVFGAVANAPLSAIAGLAGIDEAAAIERLKAAGIAEASIGDSVPKLAERTGQEAFAIVGAILAPAN
jgi:hypothetical protein